MSEIFLSEDKEGSGITLMISPEDYKAILAELDRDTTDNSALRKTMQTPPPWEKK